MPPTTEDLLIIINGKTATKNIPFTGLRIVNERGDRVSTCDFILEDGFGFGLVQWQTIVIYSTDMATVHFNGFIMDFSSKKAGVKINYQVKCSSIEILLQKAIVSGSETGTDAEILAAILANGYPDLSDIFDWTSGISAVLSSDIDLDFQDSTLLDALEALSKKSGADYSQGYNASARTNINKNPAFANNMDFYASTIVAGTNKFSTYGGTWNPANTVYNGSGGESGGGVIMTSQAIGGQNVAFLRVGRTTQGTSYTTLFRINRATETWFAMKIRIKLVSASNFAGLFFVGTTYNLDGTIYQSDINLLDSGIVDDGTWQTAKNAVDLSDSGNIPESGYLEIMIMGLDGINTFVYSVDSFMFETLTGAGKPVAGTYFDGSFSDAYWLGETHASASATGANPLRWGSNRDAPFDIDIGNMDELVSDLNINFNGFDGINSLIVTGGFQWVDVDWEFAGDNQQVRFDLPTRVYPAESLTQPVMYHNIGSDETPNWSARVVVTRQTGFGGGDTLYDLEDFWAEFQGPAPDLKRSWRIVGRIRQRLRATVLNEENIDLVGLEMTDTLYIEEATGSEAFDIGQAELAKRAPDMTVTFTTFEPGILAGDEIDIVDSAQNISETLIIERVTRTYLGGGFGKFRIECGRYNTDVTDIIKGISDTADPKVPVGDDTVSVTLRILTDSDDAQLTDANGLLLADIAP